MRNPIGLKCGPSLTPDGLLELIDLLNPANEWTADTDLLWPDKVGEHLA